MGEPRRAGDVHAAVDRVNPGRAGIGHDDPGRPQDRQPADNAEAPVQGLCGKRLAVFNADFDNHVTRHAMRGGHIAQGLAHHFPRHRIDGRFAGRNGKTGPRDRANSLARAKRNAGSGRAPADRGKDERPVRHVRVVARVLHDAGARLAILPRRRRERECGALAAGQCHLDGIGKRAAEQGRVGRFRRGSGARARRPSFAELTVLLVHGDRYRTQMMPRHGTRAQ